MDLKVIEEISQSHMPRWMNWKGSLGMAFTAATGVVAKAADGRSMSS